MMTTHCSEDELQLLAAGQQLPETARMQHVESCASCQEQIAAYRLILSCIKQQPAATFDFDLEDIVLRQIQPIRSKRTTRALWPALIAVFTGGCLYLFRNNFLHLVSGISAVFLLLSIVACMGIIVLKVLRLYQSYERKIERLDLSE